MDFEGKKIIYVQTYGVDDDKRRLATPFFLAAAAAAMDIEAAIYFTMNGATLLKKGVAEELIVPKAGGGGAPLSYFIKQAMDMGVELLVCQPSLDLHGLTMDDLIDGVRMIGGAAFNSLALEADAVISF